MENLASLHHVDGRQFEMHDCSFHHSLQQLRSHLDEMNTRTSALLSRNHQDQEQRELQNDSLSLPNGPAFWQLYRALRTDVRGLEARIELIEDRLEGISNRLDVVEPTLLTPLASPTTPTYIRAFDPGNIQSPVNPETTASGVQPVAVKKDLSSNPYAELTSASDVMIFDPSLSEDNDQQLATSDVTIFLAKLRRASRIKRIANPERLLRGTALQIYRLGYSTEGRNFYDTDEGDLDLDAFESVLLALFKPNARDLMEAETYTMTDFRNGRRLIEDYAFKMLSLGRYLENCGPTEQNQLTISYIQRGIRIPAATTVFFNNMVSVEDLPELLVRLRRLEKLLSSDSQHCEADDAQSHASCGRPGEIGAPFQSRRASDSSSKRDLLGDRDSPSIPYPWHSLSDFDARELPGTPVPQTLNQLGPRSQDGALQGHVSWPAPAASELSYRKDIVRGFGNENDSGDGRSEREERPDDIFGIRPWDIARRTSEEVSPWPNMREQLHARPMGNELANAPRFGGWPFYSRQQNMGSQLLDNWPQAPQVESPCSAPPYLRRYDSGALGTNTRQSDNPFQRRWPVSSPQSYESVPDRTRARFQSYAESENDICERLQGAAD